MAVTQKCLRCKEQINIEDLIDGYCACCIYDLHEQALEESVEDNETH